MKSLFIATIALLFALPMSAQNAGNGPKISFEKEVHDYGAIAQNSDGHCTFVFTNTGDEPLIISNAKGSCQCTVPDWPKQPIAPGESASIKVKYNTARVGPINKSVTLTTNDSASPTQVLRIKGQVNAAEISNAPEKPAVVGAPVTTGGE